MRKPGDDDKVDWSPRDRNLDAVLWWALGLAVLLFATLYFLLR